MYRSLLNAGASIQMPRTASATDFRERAEQSMVSNAFEAPLSNCRIVVVEVGPAIQK